MGTDIQVFSLQWIDTNLAKKQNITIALAKAKEYFKDYASNIINCVKSKLEESQIYDILPSVFQKELVEITKENLSLGYNVIIQKIVQVISLLIYPLNIM